MATKKQTLLLGDEDSLRKQWREIAATSADDKPTLMMVAARRSGLSASAIEALARSEEFASYDIDVDMQLSDAVSKVDTVVEQPIKQTAAPIDDLEEEFAPNPAEIQARQEAASLIEGSVISTECLGVGVVGQSFKLRIVIQHSSLTSLKESVVSDATGTIGVIDAVVKPLKTVEAKLGSVPVRHSTIELDVMPFKTGEVETPSFLVHLSDGKYVNVGGVKAMVETPNIDEQSVQKLLTDKKLPSAAKALLLFMLRHNLQSISLIGAAQTSLCSKIELQQAFASLARIPENIYRSPNAQWITLRKYRRIMP